MARIFLLVQLMFEWASSFLILSRALDQKVDYYCHKPLNVCTLFLFEVSPSPFRGKKRNVIHYHLQLFLPVFCLNYFFCINFHISCLFDVIIESASEWKGKKKHWGMCLRFNKRPFVKLHYLLKLWMISGTGFGFFNILLYLEVAA